MDRLGRIDPRAKRVSSDVARQSRSGPWPGIAREGRIPLLYVAGTGHSGSTLVSFVLNNHPDIFAIGEMHAPVNAFGHPPRRLCSCGQSIADCPFFEEMARCFKRQACKLGPRWDLQYRLSQHPLLNRLMTGSLRSNALETVRGAAWQLVPGVRRRVARLDRETVLFAGAALKISGKRIFLDTSKNPQRIWHLNHIPEVSLKVVHLVRDPRSFVYTRMWDRRSSPPQRTARSTDVLATTWLTVNLNVDRHLRAIPRENWIRLQLEELCQDTQRALREVTRFLGVSPMPVPEDYRRVPHHIMGNAMRLQPARPIRLDERWRENLAAADLRIVVSKTRKLARAYGYQL